MLIESISREPLQFHVLPFDAPKIRHALQVSLTFFFQSVSDRLERLISLLSFYIYDRPLTEINVIASVCALNLRIKF